MATTAQDSNGDNNWRFIILLLIFILGMFLMFIMQSCNVTKKVTDNSKIEREDSVSTSMLRFDNNLTLTLHDDRESGKWVDKETVDSQMAEKKEEEVKAEQEIHAAEERAKGQVETPAPEAPKQDFTSSLIMKDDEDLPF